MSAKRDLSHLTQEENADGNPSQNVKKTKTKKIQTDEPSSKGKCIQTSQKDLKESQAIWEKNKKSSLEKQEREKHTIESVISGIKKLSITLPESQQQLPSCQTDQNTLAQQLPTSEQPDSCLEQLQSPSSPTDPSSPQQSPPGQDDSLLTLLPSHSGPTDEVKNTEAVTPQASNLEETAANKSSSHERACEPNFLCQQLLRSEPLLGIGDYQIYFTEFYNRLDNKLTKLNLRYKTEAEFMKRKNDYDRIKYVYQFEEIRNLEISVYNSKSEYFANELEDQYNNSCVQTPVGRLWQGFHLINRSIQFTPGVNKKAIGIRLMKRAWINLLMKKFDEAKEDAEKSLEYHSDPADIWNSFEILGHCYAKKADCGLSEFYFEEALVGLQKSGLDNLMKSTTSDRISRVYNHVKGRNHVEAAHENCDEKLIPQISHGIHSTLKCATQAVEVKVDKETGRGLYARKEIKPGDVMIVEKAYVSALNRENLQTHCNYCYKRIRSSIPCDTCSRIWFCSVKCLEKSKVGFHSSECYVLDLLYDEIIGKMGILVFRILLRLTWKNVKLLRKSRKIDTKLPDSHPLHSEFNFMENYHTDNYLTTYKLVTNSTKRVFTDLFKSTIIAVYLKQCLKEVGFFQEEKVSLDDEMFVASLILRHLQNSSSNASNITEFIIGKNYLEKGSILELGGGIYPTNSLINHSCNPNLLRYFIGAECIVRATKVIKKDDQLFINYCTAFDMMLKEERRLMLMNQYLFDCKCIACKENWSSYLEAVHMKFACPENDCSGKVEYDGNDKIECPSCHYRRKLGSLMMEAKGKIKEYQKSLDHLKAGLKDKALLAAKNFQIYADRKIIPPSKCITECQEVFKRCFHLQGNVFFD